MTIEKTFVTKEEKVESRWGGAPSCPQGLGLNGPIGPFKPSVNIKLPDMHKLGLLVLALIVRAKECMHGLPASNTGSSS